MTDVEERRQGHIHVGFPSAGEEKHRQWDEYRSSDE
jgi:hypothetical protein